MKNDRSKKWNKELSKYFKRSFFTKRTTFLKILKKNRVFFQYEGFFLKELKNDFTERSFNKDGKWTTPLRTNEIIFISILNKERNKLFTKNDRMNWNKTEHVHLYLWQPRNIEKRNKLYTLVYTRWISILNPEIHNTKLLTSG